MNSILSCSFIKCGRRLLPSCTTVITFVWFCASLSLFPAFGASAENAVPRETARAKQARQAFEDALALASVRDVAGAELILSEGLAAKPNTARWHLQLAQRQAQLATELARRGRVSRPTAERALSQLDKAVRLARATDRSLLSAAKSLEGRLRERLLGDLPGARSAYAMAQQHQPESVAAREALNRLDESQANLIRKGAGKP